VAVADEYVPRRQVTHAWAEGMPGTVDMVPAGHGVQGPTPLPYVPGLQIVQAVGTAFTA